MTVLSVLYSIHVFIENKSSHIKRFTFNLFSLRFTITAVICWSMNIRMVASMAGAALRSINHQGFLSLIGLINQGRPGLVGWIIVKVIIMEMCLNMFTVYWIWMARKSAGILRSAVQYFVWLFLYINLPRSKSTEGTNNSHVWKWRWSVHKPIVSEVQTHTNS